LTSLEVHHIDFDRENNSPGNHIALCHVCHASAHDYSLTSGMILEIKKDLRSKPPPVHRFQELIIQQSADQIRQRFRAPAMSEPSRIGQAIAMVEYWLGSSWIKDEYLAQHALLKLIRLQRLSGLPAHLRDARRRIRDAEQYARNLPPDLAVEAAYNSAYVDYLESDGPAWSGGLKRALEGLEAACSLTVEDFSRAHFRVIQSGMSLLMAKQPIDIVALSREVNALKALDPLGARNAVGHLAEDALQRHDPDDATQYTEMFSALTSELGGFPDLSRLDYYRGRLALREGNANEAARLLRRSAGWRVQLGFAEGLSQVRAYLGRAYEELAKETGDEKDLERAEREYQRGAELHRNANMRGRELCMQRLESHRLTTEQRRRGQGR